MRETKGESAGHAYSAPARKKFTYSDEIRRFQGAKLAREKKRKDQETKNFKKAAALRKYAKLCEKEGIQSDRVRTGKKSDSEEEPKRRETKEKKRPYEREEESAKKLRVERELRDAQRAQWDREKEEALNKREEKRKLMMKRTKKGQPVLGNHIKSMLEKLQKAN
ncbi:hypothetical protein B484DRAFT_452685 [Ochromonadaceae sp. CCMP2298]|nr:hypothetical protein B484DRAFT_452685 [Ochromonadaceae sp. CCMP2298]|mmetsp:Transcript_21499/g.47819  ORF Transcript_21499/g.47819 Transcript_21499/m.47819 type:complete len:165 (-) Transcript_21499:188-682(-)